MPRVFRSLALIALIAGSSGCGEGSNKIPDNAASPEYGLESKDKMASMYGTPKAEKVQSNNAADQMKNMYNR